MATKPNAKPTKPATAAKAAPAPTPAPVAAAKPAAKAATAPAAAKPVKQQAVSPEARWRMVAEAAFFIAEKRGFQGGDPAQDWAKAEAQIAALLSKA